MRQTLIRRNSSATSTSSSAVPCFDLVVPHLDLDAAVLRAARLRRVRSRRAAVSPAHSYAMPSAGKNERALQQLGDLAGALARQALRCRRIRPPAPATAAAYRRGRRGAAARCAGRACRRGFAQLRDRAVGNLRDADGEADRRHEVRELDRLELLGRDLLHLEAVAGARVEEIRIVHPLRRLDLAGQVPLDGLAARRLAQQLRLGGASPHASAAANEACANRCCALHSRFPLRRSRASVGSPRRQNTSGSIASS